VDPERARSYHLTVIEPVDLAEFAIVDDDIARAAVGVGNPSRLRMWTVNVPLPRRSSLGRG